MYTIYEKSTTEGLTPLGTCDHRTAEYLRSQFSNLIFTETEAAETETTETEATEPELISPKDKENFDLFALGVAIGLAGCFLALVLEIIK